MAKRHISLKDLAVELNVSISTVSRALKNHPDISPSLKLKVMELAKERNYTANPLAMGLLKQETKMIGVIVPDLVTHFYSSIISGIEEEAKRRGYFIILSASNESMEKEIESVSNLLKARVDGMIVCLSKETNQYDHFIRLVDNEIPLVFFDRVCLPGLVPGVVADNVEAASGITEHLHNAGYRRIAYISGPEHLNISAERLKGYQLGLTKCGLPYDPALLRRCDLSTEEATSQTASLMNQSNPPDAIFGINDTVIFSALKEVQRRGLRIPEDIGLAGIADDFHANFTSPQLTSILHPTHEIGIRTANLFFKRIKDPAFVATEVVKTRLIVRESTRNQ